MIESDRVSGRPLERFRGWLPGNRPIIKFRRDASQKTLQPGECWTALWRPARFSLMSRQGGVQALWPPWKQSTRAQLLDQMAMQRIEHFRVGIVVHVIDDGQRQDPITG